MSVIPRAPISPPATKPSDERYYDARDLELELQRTFQICHECRMCVGYCGSFPELFSRVDRDIEAGRAEGAEALTYEDFKVVGDECWQCKLCYIKCPYTADEQATELLDFPRLMAREKAVRARREGIPLVDQILGEPHLVGALGGGVLAPVSNLILANRLIRKGQEIATGISADFPLPKMAPERFSEWFHRREKERAHAAGAAALESAAPAKEEQHVALFATCYGEYNTPNFAKAAVLVLEHNGFTVHLPELNGEQATCCGMPNLDGGDIAAFIEKAKFNVRLLLPHVRAGRRIVVPGPTCGYTMKREWAEYLETPEAREVADATVDLMEFLVMLGKQKKLNRDFKQSLGNVAYHAACHLRAQKIGFPGARVLGAVPDTDVRVIEQCSAVDGTWGMKAAHYETGRKYAAKLVREVAQANAQVVVSDCSLAGLRINKENGVVVMHPVEALAKAYGLLEELR